MSRKQAAEVLERMRTLAEELRRANELYYQQGRPELSDSQYDEMMRELRGLEAKHPELREEDSPTQSVGASPSRGATKRAHGVPMLSLDSLTSPEEVQDFDLKARKGLELEEPLSWVLEPKYDGVSASLVYEDGVLIQGLTRGDGRQGELITENLRRVQGIPDVLKGSSFPARVELRGEVILAQSRFREIREAQEARGENPFRNARNAVAGSLKRLDPTGLEDLGLDFFFWGFGELNGWRDLECYTELAERVQSAGLRVSPLLETGKGPESILAYHQRLEAQREELDYEMDGVVAKLDLLAQQRQLGRTARVPRWSLAFKFAPRRGTTRVLDIAVQVGRTGALTPVAHLEPVELAGVTVQRASLHNFGLLAERDLRIGDEVVVERAGDVIPELIEVKLDARPEDSEPFAMPEACPVCGSSVEKEGAFLYCLNIDCEAQVTRRITHLASRRALDIDRLGAKYVAQLREAGLLDRVEDVFRLPEREAEILKLERWGPKSFANLVREIDSARRPPLARFLYALGIRHVGEKIAQDLAEGFESLEALSVAEAEALEEIDGVGEVVARELAEFFRLPATLSFLEALAEAGVEVQVLQPSGDRGKEAGPLAGRVYCFTGGLDSMSRDEAKRRVEALGAQSSGSVTKKVTHVVAGAKAGSKLAKAEKLGLVILDEEALLAELADLGV
ncbi:MAG: DNA ligase (NAD(+)) LigA [Planctomycetota bacterium]|nr:MAG: DNA ligase (NAD(+)) LigA [Planctomycetota bacterium]